MPQRSEMNDRPLESCPIPFRPAAKTGIQDALPRLYANARRQNCAARGPHRGIVYGSARQS